MYDIHSHILPNFDDGAENLDSALEMAAIATADGVTHMACTPHIYPGLYDYDTKSIASAVDAFREQLRQAGIGLNITTGADIQMVPEIISRLKQKTMPTINDSRYLLFEPPHHVAPFNFVSAVTDICSTGFVPIITHPERLTWIEDHYEEFMQALDKGAWLQITAGSITGHFGQHAQYWAERMMDEGVVHVIASDTHNTSGRSPRLSEGAEAAIRWVGKQEATAMVMDRPQAVWNNIPIEDITMPHGFDEEGKPLRKKKAGLLKRLFGKN